MEKDRMRFVSRDLNSLIKSSVELNKWTQRLMYQLQTGKFHSDFDENRVKLILILAQIEGACAEAKSVSYQLSQFEVW